MSQKETLRIKLTTGGGTIGILVLVLATDSKKVLETLALGGDNPELQRLALDDPYKNFRDGLLDARFYTKYNPAVTADLERYLQKVTRNLEFVDRLYAALAKEKKNDLQFLFENELSVVLGDRQLTFDFRYEPLSDAEEEAEEEALNDDVQIDPEGDPAAQDDGAPNPAWFVPLRFSLSPLEGTPLNELKVGDEVFVKVTDPKHPLAEAFLEMQAALADEGTSPPQEYLATIKELREHPGHGFWAVLSLPDATDGLVDEEERGIRVKRPHAPENMEDPEALIDEKTAMKGLHAEPHGGASPVHHRPKPAQAPREEVPLKLIIAFAAGAVFLSILLLMLL